MVVLLFPIDSSTKVQKWVQLNYFISKPNNYGVLIMSRVSVATISRMGIMFPKWQALRYIYYTASFTANAPQAITSHSIIIVLQKRK
jgi:hypothetical protein